jgi:hypothetical protein
VLAALGEAVFVFVDQLASASAHGYVCEQSQSAAERERLRRELADILLCDRSDSGAVRSAASLGGWTAPDEAALVLVDESSRLARAALARPDRRCLPVRRRDMYGAIVPGPLVPLRKREIAGALGGARAVIGHCVPIDDFPASARHCQVGELPGRCQDRWS